MYESNHKDSDFDDLPFDGDQMLISGWWINCVNNCIIFSSKNGLIVYA